MWFILPMRVWLSALNTFRTEIGKKENSNKITIKINEPNKSQINKEWENEIKLEWNWKLEI